MIVGTAKTTLLGTAFHIRKLIEVREAVSIDFLLAVFSCGDRTPGRELCPERRSRVRNYQYNSEYRRGDSEYSATIDGIVPQVAIQIWHLWLC